MRYDLEERTYRFAVDVRIFVKKRGNSCSVVEDGRQLIRCSASVAANYIEANNSISKRDFVYRIKICRKESKESILFSRLIEANSDESNIERKRLVNEATELMKIFGSILHKSK